MGQDDRSLLDARRAYFDYNGFGTETYHVPWVLVRAGPLRMWVPNSSARRRVLPAHDVHHVLTDYRTDWRGEAQISCFEMASGPPLAPSVLPYGCFTIMVGMCIDPAAMRLAHRRGRHAKNLYRAEITDDLLAKSVEEVRRELLLDRPIPEATWRDDIAFVAMLAAVTLYFLVSTLFTLLLQPLMPFVLLWGWWQNGRVAYGDAGDRSRPGETQSA